MPVYEITAQGPTCGEQCLDILAAHRDETPLRRVWDLGNGMAAYARPAKKARRGPEPTARPFDAAVFQARDKDKPTDTKHTVSLIKDIVDLLVMPPQIADDVEERSYLIRASIDELVSRGFDRKDLSLTVVFRTSLAMAAWLVIGEIITNELSLGDNAKLGFVVPEDWHQIAREVIHTGPTGTSSSISLRDVDSLLNAILAWNLEHDVDSVVSWTQLPPAAFIRQHSSDSKDDTAFVRATWIMDRFTQTYPDSWSTPSLDIEWKYIHGREVGCGDASQMKLRRLSREDIAIAIAGRAVEGRGRAERSTRKFRATDFTVTAIELLSSGKYDSAAAMYEALRKLDPSDPDLANNLGFCLMPVNPERALFCLNESAALSKTVNSVTWANKIAVLYLLGLDADAYELAQQECEGAEMATAWLWLIDDSRKIAGLGTDVYIGRYVKGLESKLEASMND